MGRKERSGLNPQIYEEACEWFVEFRGGGIGASQRRDLDAWLRKSPEHLRAYLEIAAIWNDGPSLDPAGKWDTETLLAQAAEEPDNVVTIATRGTASGGVAARADAADADRADVVRANAMRSRIASLSVTRRFLALAASLLVVCAAAWLYTQRNIYATDIGEQRSIRLADGSTIDLNSRSKVEVRYSGGDRSIDLLEGQALFQVAKDARRPFVVTSGDTRVRAVGTQFDVNRRKSGTIVTVLEGRVAVLSEHANARASSSIGSVVHEGAVSGSAHTPTLTPDSRDKSVERAVYLSAGEQLSLTASIPSQHPVSVNVTAATAWKQRQLMFESATLAEVAEEFNRYNERQLIVKGADLYDFHISGVFSSIEPNGLLDFLRAQPGVEVTETDSGYRVARKSP